MQQYTLSHITSGKKINKTPLFDSHTASKKQNWKIHRGWRTAKGNSGICWKLWIANVRGNPLLENIFTLYSEHMNARRNLTPLFHLLFSYPLFLTHYYTLASFSLTKHCHCCNFTARERLPYKKEGLSFTQGTGKALKNFSHQELSHKALALHTYCFLLPTCSSICFILI